MATAKRTGRIDRGPCPRGKPNTALICMLRMAIVSSAGTGQS